MVSLHQLKRPATLKHSMQRVGRGQGSGRGKQSGRGGKGQTARAGNKRRPEWRDIIKKLPKRRGYGKNRGRTVISGPSVLALPLARLEAAFESGATISRKSLIESGLLGRKARPVKIVGMGAISKKLTVQGIQVSGSSRAAIEKAGGQVIL